ncbi:MAG: amidase family protein [Mycoplasma sp.]
MKNNKYLETYNSSIEKLNEINKLNPISLETVPFNHIENTTNPLNGIVYSLKDNIATKDIKTTGGSLFLKNYIPKYNATLKTLLDESGAICISKDNLDEFGLGGTGTFSGFGIVKNAFDDTRIAGGSSSGSSVIVAKDVVSFSIATDTGDSIRRPASFQGIYGFKPTYGRISRYGVFPYSPSFDHVGILANDISTISNVMNVISKKDKNDMTSIESNEKFDVNAIDVKQLKFAIITEAVDHMLDGEKYEFIKYIDDLKSKGINIEEISFPIKLLELIDPVYKTITYGEATTCWANLSGILFGEQIEGKNFVETLRNSRTQNFGRQLKRRFVIGAYSTSSENYLEIFQESKKIRTMIINECNKIFSSYDAILLPGASSIAPLIQDELDHKNTSSISDDALQMANFGGYPSITIPAIKFNDAFLGLNITCKLFEDTKTLSIAKILSEVK